MKKILICFFVLNILLLVGCGSMNSSYDNTNTTIATNTSDTALWEQAVQADDCKMFQKSDMKYDRYSVTWENNKGQAYLEYRDDKVYLTYKSELGECSDEKFDYIQSNYLTETEFYEEDVNSDGYKELLISYTQGTGTGCTYGAMCIYDLNNNELTPLFEKNNFSDEQKQDIFDIITTWNSKGFQEKSEVVINDISSVKTSFFKPSLVNLNGKYMVKVEFTLPDSGGKEYEKSKYFYALLEFHNEQLDIDSLWCEL